MNHKGQAGLVQAFIGIMVAVIVAVGVAIPVVLDTIDNSTVGGTARTVLNLLPLMLALVLFVAVASLIAFK